MKNRRKLRIRIYDDRPEGVAYLEIKRRTGETVHKLRATVRKSACQSMLRGDHLSPDDLESMSEVGLRALDEFCDAKERYGADGVAYVDYQRVAYVSRTADNCRVTFDRHLVSRPYSPLDGLCPPPESKPVDMAASCWSSSTTAGAAVDARPGAHVQSAALFVSEVRVLCGCARRRSGGWIG